MRFKAYLNEYRIADKGEFQEEDWNSIPWEYDIRSGLWYIKNGIVYNNATKKGKIRKPYYSFTWGHADLEGFEPALQDTIVHGKIHGKIIKIYSYTGSSSSLEQKAIDAIYRFIPEKK